MESKKISEDINKVKAKIYSYKKKAPMQMPGDHISDIRKPLSMARETERRLTFKLHRAERKEGVTKEKERRNQDSSMRND